MPLGTIVAPAIFARSFPDQCAKKYQEIDTLKGLQSTTETQLNQLRQELNQTRDVVSDELTLNSFQEEVKELNSPPARRSVPLVKLPN